MKTQVSFKEVIACKYVERECRSHNLNCEQIDDTTLRIDCKRVFNNKYYYLLSNKPFLGDEIFVKSKYIEWVSSYDWN